jgi:hypothetical protein
MNIVQLEDDIKSLPDDRLMTEMQAPTGGFPQYLVLSEIKRRKQMRDDYRGRMAAHEKTPPRPTIAEETVQEGISSIMPSNIPQGAPPQGMPMAQGMPVNRPASIEGGGLESLMPQGQGMPQGMPMGMAGGGRLPPFGILGALEGGIESDTSMGGMLPALYEYYMKKKEEEEEEEGMAGGGRTNRVMLGKTNYQGATPPSPFGYGTDAYNPFDYLQQYGIDPTAMATLTDAEKLAQERYLDYYSPERRKEREKFSKGMNMLRAGLAVGTARTPEQLSQSMGPVIEGAIAGRAAGEKEEMAGLGAAAQMSKLERDRALKMAELGLRADYNRAIIEQAKGKDNPIVNLAKSLAKNMPQEYGGKRLPDIDDKGNPILDANNKPTYEQGRGTAADGKVAEYNFEAYESASKSLKTMGSYQRAGVSEAEYIEAELAKSEWRISVMADAKRKGYKAGTDEYNDYLKERDNTKREELKIIYNQYMAPYLSL